ncbi:MAG: hypothetical protein K1X74_18460 [Pirellulales bacterium]|nr:hypothetical protein [Pirellulales bacterium]
MRILGGLVLGCLFLPLLAAAADAASLDLTAAVVVVPAQSPPRQQRAVKLLLDEVEARSRVRWTVAHTWPEDARQAVIVVGQRAQLAEFSAALPENEIRGNDRPEGYLLRTLQRSDRTASIAVVGNDERGVLFGVGRLLRELRMRPGQVSLPGDMRHDTAPAHAVRGHQLGYRPKTNSYDAWDLDQWERYIADLAVFGSNMIELIPPRSDDDADSPHFPRPPLEMMAGMSRICDELGLDVWIWYPAMDEDYSTDAAIARSVEEWGAVLKHLPRVDAIFVPSGDPGHTRPRELMRLLEAQTAQLVKLHPGAEMWVTVQSFTGEWFAEMLELLRAEPTWLTGIGFGPQTRITVQQLREQLPRRYPIRLYPDITHSMRCQYPVLDWDVAFARTEAREVINPRPRAEAAIFAQTIDYSIGFGTYSEGCNDDVNKIVWSLKGWDPAYEVEQILEDYGRYFLGEGVAPPQAFLQLEDNWRNAAHAEQTIQDTLKTWQAIERSAPPALRRNWRLLQPLYRAYYDAYVARRAAYERDREKEVRRVLADVPPGQSLATLDRAEQHLALAEAFPVAGDLRTRVFQLAEALFQSIRMQLSVKLYDAIEVGRGANLDTVDVPLNNRNWLRRELKAIRALTDESERRARIDELVHWDSPPAGSFYDDLGVPNRQPHVVFPKVDHEPGYRDPLIWPTTGFENDPTWRISWCTHLDTLYEQPLRMRYEELDPQAAYRVRVVYGGDNDEVQVRLSTEHPARPIHAWIDKPRPLSPVEFDVPHEATAEGHLELLFESPPGRGGPGRGPQVAEVWLLKQ